MKKGDILALREEIPGQYNQFLLSHQAGLDFKTPINSSGWREL